MDFNDQITVLIPSSPIKRNPSIGMIQATIGLVRFQLPTARILVSCDGIRTEQENMRENYHQYLDNLHEWSLTQKNIEIIIFGDHLHQTGMIKKILPIVNT